ncbi:MAG: glycosyltransferase family 4 protein [Fuerstiella sp.]
MRIAIITAGGAGMFCGSCMQDNTLARTLRLAGEDAVLVPTYTPIRVDEEDVSSDRVFLGGINVYLDSKVPGWKRLPRWMTSWLNRPRLISWLSRFGNNTDAAGLGALTLDMLTGSAGPQQREIRDFVQYLVTELKPDLIVFSNALLSGVLPDLRAAFSGPVLCVLQGDDVFLEGLTSRWKPRVMDRLRANCRLFDGFLTHSRYYREFMSDYLSLPAHKFRQIPLTIDADYTPPSASLTDLRSRRGDRFRIGYFARVCPEKGIHTLLQAAAGMLPDLPQAELAIGGYVPDQYRRWFHQLLADTSVRAPGRIHWLGSPADRLQKLQIISDFDVLCVPTDYHEPKGLYVLEAGLVGVPAVLPRHGAFPELVESLGFGTLYDATQPDGLVLALRQAVEQGTAPYEQLPLRVRQCYSMEATSPALQELVSSFAVQPA